MERLHWLAAAVSTLGVAGLLPADNAKILEQTLFSADEQSFRYSECSIVELEEDRELLTAVQRLRRRRARQLALAHHGLAIS